MAIAHTLKEFPYISMDDREAPEEERTTFMLKTLSAKEQEQVEDSVPTEFESEVKGGKVSRAKRKKQIAEDGSKVSMKMKTGARVNAYLRIGLVGWKNFRDHKGEQVEFAAPELGMCSWNNIDKLGPDLRFELSGAIEDGNTITEEEEKNS